MSSPIDPGGRRDEEGSTHLRAYGNDGRLLAQLLGSTFSTR